MPENIGIANLCEFFNELAAMVLQTPVNLPVLYPVGSLEKVLDVRGMGPEAGREGLHLGVQDSVVALPRNRFLNPKSVFVMK